MLASTLFVASISALFAGTSAAPTTINPNWRYVQLRIFPQASCVQPNLGEAGIYGSDNNKCLSFGTDTIKSVSIERVDPGCTVNFYSDLKCHLDHHIVSEAGCLSGDKYYRSYKMECKL